LLALPDVNKNVYLSARNLQRTDVMEASTLNSYKVLNADVLVLTENAVNVIDGILNK
ncbi:MAG: 50S ribosomal protein L4, partial [Prevotella sp.]|nr:50S ribosomal protein L4 [Prevotella sp.]